MPLALPDVQALRFDDVKSDKALQIEVLRTYYRLFGDEPCGSCTDKMRGYLSKIKAYTMATIEVSKDFKFKDGVTGVPMEFGSRDILTPGTLTTDRAIAFLRVNPNRIKLFTTAPANWREMLEGDKPKRTAAEVVADIPGMGAEELVKLREGEKRKTVLKAIDKALNEKSPD